MVTGFMRTISKLVLIKQVSRSLHRSKSLWKGSGHVRKKMLGCRSVHPVPSANDSRDSKKRAKERRATKKRERIEMKEMIRRNELDLL